MSRGIIEKLARFFHEHFSLDHDTEHPNWPKDGCQVCISAAHEFLPILADEREKVRKMFLEKLKKHREFVSERNIQPYDAIRESELIIAESAIRQLDLTKPKSDLAASSREEGGDAK